MNKIKTMQDNSPKDIVCSRCSHIIVSAAKAQGLRERDIQFFVHQHRCVRAMEAKRDFEQEVR